MAKRITDISDISSNRMDNDSLEGNTQQPVIDLDKHYIQFAINSDLIQKNIDKEEGDESMNILSKEAGLSIQSNLKIENLTTIRGKMFDEFNQKTNTISENIMKISKKENCDKKQVSLFAEKKKKKKKKWSSICKRYKSAVPLSADLYRLQIDDHKNEKIYSRRRNKPKL